MLSRMGSAGSVWNGLAHGPARRVMRPSLDARREPAHPELLDHRAHRSRQVHARGPPARGDRHGEPAGGPGAVPRQHGAGARARDHHQGPDRPHALSGPRRRRVRAEPDRHAGARRLRLRGLALPGRLRGRDPGRRREPGRRGADARQRLPGARSRSRDHPRHQQDRPALGRRGGGAARDRGGDRARRDRRGPRLGQGGRRHRRDPRAGRQPGAPAARRPGGAAQGDRLRLLVRLVPRGGDAGAGLRGEARAAPAHPALVEPQGVRRAGAGRVRTLLAPPAAGLDRADVRAVALPAAPAERPWPTAARVTP